MQVRCTCFVVTRPQAWRATESYISKARPKVCILENLSSLMNEAEPGVQPDAEYIMSRLKSFGYAARVRFSALRASVPSPDRSEVERSIVRWDLSGGMPPSSDPHLSGRASRGIALVARESGALSS